MDVGVKDLKNNLSKYLERVRRGERIRVTLRGRPIAELRSVGEPEVDDDLRRLADEGKLTLATRQKDREPPAPLDLGYSASDLIIAEREEDRGR
jgi:prevent-host-death family protein